MATSEKCLYRFPYSCYALKVQALLALRGERARVVDVTYGERAELVALTGGSPYVPVLVLEDGRVVTDSRRISEVLVAEGAGRALVPAGLEGPVWAFADWCDAVLEDVAFRLASPGIRPRFGSAWERSLFTLVKERKFGPGCIERWEAERGELMARARALLAPVERTLAQRPFVFGEQPTLADAALYGQLAMLAYADPRLPEQLSAPVARHAQRLAQLAG